MLLHLPLELFQQTAASYDDRAARVNVLKSLSLTCRMLQSPAQSLLFDNIIVCLHRKQYNTSRIDALKQHNLCRYIKRIKFLGFNIGDDQDTTFTPYVVMETLVSAGASFNAIDIGGLFNYDFRKLPMPLPLPPFHAGTRCLHALQSLRIDTTLQVSIIPRILEHAINLTNLHLQYVSEICISAGSMPSLRKVTFEECSYRCVCQLLAHAAHSLYTIHWRHSNYLLPSQTAPEYMHSLPQLPHVTELRFWSFITIPTHQITLQTLLACTPNLITLHTIATINLASMKQAMPTLFTSLKHIRLDAVYEDDDQDYTPDWSYLPNLTALTIAEFQAIGEPDRAQRFVDQLPASIKSVTVNFGRQSLEQLLPNINYVVDKLSSHPQVEQVHIYIGHTQRRKQMGALKDQSDLFTKIDVVTIAKLEQLNLPRSPAIYFYDMADFIWQSSESGGAARTVL